jgi:hypothetical protein
LLYVVFFLDTVLTAGPAPEDFGFLRRRTTMLDLTKAEDLAKGGRSIGNFFTKRVQELEKTHALHAGLAAHHGAAAAEHTTHAANYKAAHDGLPDDHELKSHLAKGHTHHITMAAHHDAIAKLHAAHAESVKTEVDAMKAMAAEWAGTTSPGGLARAAGAPGNGGAAAPFAPSGNVYYDMVQETTAVLTKKTLEKFDTDPEVQEYMRKKAMEMIGQAIGDTVRPTEVSVVAPTAPAFGIRAVPRAGQKSISSEAPAIALEFQKVFSSDDGEEGQLRQ